MINVQLICRDRVSVAGGLRNPMCSLFPTEVSCNIPTVGAGGDEQDNNGLCVLTQVLNDEWRSQYLYEYLAEYNQWEDLSPALVLVHVRSSLVNIEHVRHNFNPLIRLNQIWSSLQNGQLNPQKRLAFLVTFLAVNENHNLQVRHKYDKSSHKCLKYLLTKSQLGDWFVLYQLSKNCNKYFYREFIKELAIELKRKPKKSKGRMESTSFPPSPSAPKRSKSPNEDQV